MKLTVRQTEAILVVFTASTFLLRMLMPNPLISQLFLISISSLAFFYFFFTSYLIHESHKSLTDALKDRLFKKGLWKQNIFVILSGTSIAILLIGILFEIFKWISAELYLNLGIIGTLVASVLSLIKYLHNRETSYFILLQRTLSYLIVGIAMKLIL